MTTCLILRGLISYNWLLYFILEICYYIWAVLVHVRRNGKGQKVNNDNNWNRVCLRDIIHPNGEITFWKRTQYNKTSFSQVNTLRVCTKTLLLLIMYIYCIYIKCKKLNFNLESVIYFVNCIIITRYSSSHYRRENFLGPSADVLFLHFIRRLKGRDGTQRIYFKYIKVTFLTKLTNWIEWLIFVIDVKSTV